MGLLSSGYLRCLCPEYHLRIGGGWVGAFSPHLPFDPLCPPAELIISVEISRCPRDTAESVRHFLPHCRGAEGLGRMEGGSRVTGPPAHWEGIEIGEMEAEEVVMIRVAERGGNLICEVGSKFRIPQSEQLCQVISSGFSSPASTLK